MKLAVNDSGKYQNKGLGDKAVIFPTLIMEIPSYNSYYDTVVEFEDKFYAIGEGSPDTNVSKKALTHRVCTMYAITQMFEDLSTGEYLDLVMGSPIQEFDNPLFKQQYKEFIMGRDNGYIKIKVNNKPYEFVITDLLLQPESIGVTIMQPELFKNKIVGVIDWGGLQANCMIYDNGKPIKSTGFTKQLGGYFIESQMISRLNTLGDGRNYQVYELPYIIENGVGEERDLIDSVMYKNFNLLLSECKQRNWNINAIDLVFTGGTSARLSTFIKKQGYIVSNKPLSDNVEGLRRLGQQWQQMKSKIQK